MSKTEYKIEPGRQEFTVTRDFDAPRELVFKAFTDPELLPKWWGPRDHSTKVDRMEMRPGGSWRYVSTDAQGNVYPFRGVCHEVTAPERMIATFEFEPFPGHVSMITATFQPLGSKTRLVQHQVFQSVEDRDGMVGAGMQRGSDDSMDRLAELLVEMKAGRA
jgi:uncharacterized protein YndB with AHSA1/START domain